MFTSLRRLIFCCGAALLFCLLTLALPTSQAQTSTPTKLWLSLGYSTLDLEPPDWAWLRAQCADGRVLETLKPMAGQLGGLVVPVFDDGRCFFDTGIALFRDRNRDGAGDERALRELLQAAQKVRVPIYLGVNALMWQISDFQSQGGVLSRNVELQELMQYGFTANVGEARFASPFHPQTRRTLAQLFDELTAKFPEAAGVALDVRLSDRAIYGFGPTARAAFIAEHELDPLDFKLDNIAGLKLSPPLRAWVDWKRRELKSFVTALADDFKRLQPQARLLLSGYAEYYINRDFHDIRTGQDWLAWAESGRFDGVLLEGRWLPPFTDIDQFGTLERWTDDLNKKASKQLSLVPVATGNHLTVLSDYLSESHALRGRSKTLDSLALYARNDEDLQQALRLASATTALAKFAAPAIGRPMADFMLPRADSRIEWNSKSTRGQCSAALFIVNEAKLLSTVLAEVSAHAAEWRNAGIKPVVISSIMPAKAGIPAKADKVSADLLHLLDERRDLMGRFGKGVTRLIADRAGYVREIESLPSDAVALRAAISKPLRDATPEFEVGKAAPDFVGVDAEGREVRLADYRGSKHVLLTFFPKCFTDG